MEQNLSRRRETGSWAPLVGVALAALTIASLITFSVVAQRTSLDGFSERGVTARPPAQESEVSITLDPAAPRTDDAGSGEGAVAIGGEPDASALIFTSDLEPASPPDPLSVASVAGLEDPDGSEAITGSESTLVAAGDVEPDPLLTFKAASAGGHDYEARGESGWKHGKKDARTAKPDKAKTKKAKKDKANKAKKAKKPKRARPEAGRRPNRHGSDASGSSSASRRSPSARGAAPSRPARASSPRAHEPSPPGHSKQKGKGHGKGRGRGHRYD